jgi:outer membrane protein TolC
MNASLHVLKSVAAMRLTGISLAVVAAFSLAGCKTFSPDGGFGPVATIAAEQLGKDAAVIRTEQDEIAVRAAVSQLLRKPLTAEAAVQVALLNNRGLQAAYNELGMSEAALVGAYLPPNPTVSIERLASGAERELEARIIGNILALLTLPARAQIAEARFQQAQLRAIEETLRVALDARRAYYRAVASREVVDFLTQSKAAAETATQLARRLGETGAMNKLDQAREQVFYAEIAAQLAVQEQRSLTEREQLIRMLGLWGPQTSFKLPGSTPTLPTRMRALPEIEVEAVRRRVDLQIARVEVDAHAQSYGLSNATRFLSVLELAGITQKKTERGTGERDNPRGLEVELQVPLFDFGEVRVRQAQETYMQAVNRLAKKAVDVRSEARDAYKRYRSTHDIARHYRNEVLPLRKIISEETLLRYNAMQIDVFDLLAEARQRMSSTIAAIEAQQDFWLASADLMGAIIGGGRGGGDVAAKAPIAATNDTGGH